MSVMGVGTVVSEGTEQNLLRRAVDSLSAMLAYWDSTLRCRFANRAYERWFGVSPETLIGMHIRDLLGPIYELNAPYIEGVLRGEPQEFERMIPDPAGGHPRYSLASYIPDVVGGVVQGFFAHVIDVSQLKRTELALRESEAKFAGIVSISAEAIITVDDEQRISIFNDGAARIFGYARGEVIGAPLDVLLPARFWEPHRRHVAAFSAGQATARHMGERKVVIVGVRKSGEEFPAEASISKLEVGGRTLLTVALRDVTERKRIEREQETLAEAGVVLSSSLDRKRTLEAIAALVVSRVADLCGVYLFEGAEPIRVTLTAAEPEKAAVCERLSQRPLRQSSILRWPVAQTGHPELVPDITPERLEAFAEDPEHLRLMRELDPKSSVTVPLSAGGRVFGALLLASTTRRRFTERDVGFAMELARRAGLAIENARLYETAQRATRARDEVLAVVAHDVRNPLSTIHLAAMALGLDAAREGAPRSRKLEVILRSVDRANRLIQDLLDTTRIEAGALSVDRAAVDARQILEDVLESQRPLASEAALTLDLDVRAPLPRISADRDRVLQVFENLVGNAIKFTPAGGRITLGAAPREDGKVAFSVTDTGAGIQEEHLAHVFDRYWRAPGEVRHGAGLGLPIAKGIVAAHGGDLWVESSPGRGTTFTFTIAAAASQERGA
jgi:PAS domain S-box-containing protein